MLHGHLSSVEALGDRRHSPYSRPVAGTAGAETACMGHMDRASPDLTPCVVVAPLCAATTTTAGGACGCTPVPPQLSDISLHSAHGARQWTRYSYDGTAASRPFLQDKLHFFKIVTNN